MTKISNLDPKDGNLNGKHLNIKTADKNFKYIFMFEYLE